MRRNFKKPTVSDYHVYRPRVFTIPGGRLRLYTKPGIFAWKRTDPAAQLLLQCLWEEGIEAGARVLDLGCGNGIIGFALLALQPDIDLHLADASYAAHTAVTISKEKLGYPGKVWLSDVTHDMPDDLRFDLVVSHLPRGRLLAEQFIREAWQRLEPGGRLYIAGATNTGIRTRAVTMAEWFDDGDILAARSGYRVMTALKREGTPLPPPGNYYQWRNASFEAHGRKWHYVTKPGVFSWQKPDGGTARLLENFVVRDGERVLDLGCGAGQVGLVAARLAGNLSVVMADDSLVAVRAAERTARLNGLETASVQLSDAGAAFIGEEPFDVVLTNPPFHIGARVEYQVANAFIEDARDILSSKGRLYVVSNAFISYEKQLESMFRQVEVVHKDASFKVVAGARPVGRVKKRQKPPLIEELRSNGASIISD